MRKIHSDKMNKTNKEGIAVYSDSIYSAFIIEDIDTNGEWVKIRYECQSGNELIIQSRNKVKMRYDEKTDDYCFRFRYIWHRLSNYLRVNYM
jgi:hypothetical protein